MQINLFSVYGRNCRVESSFGTSKCRQCCTSNECFNNAISGASFDTDAEWNDESNHPTYNEIRPRSSLDHKNRNNISNIPTHLQSRGYAGK